jgi:hypothetical protein
MYTREQSHAIIQRALELSGAAPRTSHEDLEAAAREAGVSPEVLERAAREVMAGREVAEEMRQVRSRAWAGFAAHLVPYVMINVLLAFVNFLVGGPPWMLVVTLGWGVVLATHLLRVAFPHPQRVERALERHRSRTRRRKAARKLASGARRLEGAMQERLAVWMEGAAARLHGGHDPEQTGRFRVRSAEQRDTPAEHPVERAEEPPLRRRSGS